MAFKRRRFRQIVRMRLESDKDVGMMVASEAVNGKCRMRACVRPQEPERTSPSSAIVLMSRTDAVEPMAGGATPAGFVNLTSGFVERRVG